MITVTIRDNRAIDPIGHFGLYRVIARAMVPSETRRFPWPCPSPPSPLRRSSSFSCVCADLNRNFDPAIELVLGDGSASPNGEKFAAIRLGHSWNVCFDFNTGSCYHTAVQLPVDWYAELVQAKGGMTALQYGAAIAKLGLSQRGAAFLGVDERTSRKWIAGDSRIPRERCQAIAADDRARDRAERSAITR